MSLEEDKELRIGGHQFLDCLSNEYIGKTVVFYLDNGDLISGKLKQIGFFDLKIEQFPKKELIVFKHAIFKVEFP